MADLRGLEPATAQSRSPEMAPELGLCSEWYINPDCWYEPSFSPLIARAAMAMSKDDLSISIIRTSLCELQIDSLPVMGLHPNSSASSGHGASETPNCPR